MFNPISYYRKRVAIKRDVFNADKKTLDLQKLNRFVNGKPEKQRTAPTYLRATTRDLLWNTLVKEWGDGKYGKDLDEVANNLISWCKTPDRAQNTNVRHWLKQLANAQPVERPAGESVKERSQTGSRLVIDNGNGGEKPSVAPVDDAPSHVTSEEEFDWSDAFDDARKRIEFAIPNDPNKIEPGTEDVGGNTMGSATIDSNLFAEDDSALKMSVKGLDSEDQPELHTAASDEALRQWVDALDVSENKDDPHDLFNQVDAEIAGRRRQQAEQEAATRRRPAASLRPQASKLVDQGVARLVGQQIVPAKQ